MKISIITATYNSASHIAGCLASVNNQSYQNIGHIIIDGASKDNTLEIIKSTLPKGQANRGNAIHFRTRLRIPKVYSRRSRSSLRVQSEIRKPKRDSLNFGVCLKDMVWLIPERKIHYI